MLCPLCEKETPWEGNTWRPFCSERCRLTDLGLWAGEEYRIPGPTLMVNPLKSEPGDTE